MLVSAHRVHQLLVHIVQMSAVGIATAGFFIAFVGPPAFIIPAGVPGASLGLASIPWALLLVVLGVLQAAAVHRGEFGQAWIAALGVVMFTISFYPNAGRLVVPMVGFNTLSLAVLHGFDEWLVRF